MTDQERKVMEMVLEALEKITRQFTKTPSSLKDSEARVNAHKAIETLRKALAQPANQSDCGHMEYKPFCQMCMATKQEPEENA